MFKSTLLLLALTSPATAKTHRHLQHHSDSNEMLRQVYAGVWKAAILNMFADAGQTRVELVKNVLTIENENCDNADVQSVLRDTFSAPQVRAKLEEIGMKVKCTSNLIASR